MVGISNKSVPEMTIEMVSRLEKDLQMVCVFTPAEPGDSLGGRSPEKIDVEENPTYVLTWLGETHGKSMEFGPSP